MSTVTLPKFSRWRSLLTTTTHTIAIELAIVFSSSSPSLSDPSSLARSHPALDSVQFFKPAGALQDVLLFSVAAAPGGSRDEILQVLKKNLEGVLRVDVVEYRKRVKRDEF
ncbi:hypothetical protein F5I97DRAFT_642400 [Phlebopus sp. FC_14]|nr:hypothetical protein F5I97DRAFT_642400 [Phlebopus sp. FC_14]